MHRRLFLVLIICLLEGKTHCQELPGIDVNSVLKLLKGVALPNAPVSPETVTLEPFNITWAFWGQFEGYFASEASRVHGLNSIMHDTNISWNSNTLSFRWNAIIPKLELEGDYNSVQIIPWIFGPIRISGDDKYFLKFGNFSAAIEFDFRAPLIGKMSLPHFDLHLHMNQGEGLFKFNLNNYRQDGGYEPAPQEYYDSLAYIVKTVFGDNSECLIHDDARWFFNDYIMSTVNHVIGDCNVVELMLGGFKCLRPPLFYRGLSAVGLRQTMKAIADCHYIGRKTD